MEFIVLLLSVIIFSDLEVQGQQAEGFTVVPSTQQVSVGELAVFKCQHPNGFIGWMLNGTSLVAGSLPSDISFGLETKSDGTVVGLLRIVAHLEYNGSEVVCIAFLDNFDSESTLPAILEVFDSLSGDNGFLVVPMSLNVTVGTGAQFYCQHSTADNIGWLLNGTALGSFHPPGVNTSGAAGSNGFLFMLTVATSKVHNYSTSRIECIATLLDGSLFRHTSPAILLVQDELDSVSGIQVFNGSVISLTWKSPRSLNITNVEPDIAYCVNVFLITSCEHKIIETNCTVLQPEFTFMKSNPDPRELFQFIIIPRNNVKGALNGTPSEPVIGHFDSSLPLQTDVNFYPSLKVRVLVASGNICDDASYRLSIVSIDDVDLERFESPNCPITTGTNSYKTTLTLKCKVAAQRLYRCSLFYSGMIFTVTNFTLSTHDVQNIHAVSTQSGAIEVSYTYVSGSTAKGCLVILRSMNEFHYQVVERSDNPNSITVRNLKPDKFSVSVYILSANGVPINRSANTPIQIMVKGEPHSTHITRCQGSNNTSFNYTVMHYDYWHQSVQCHFHSKDSSSCIVIVYLAPTADLFNAGNLRIYNASRFGNKAEVNITLDSYDDKLIILAYDEKKGTVTQALDCSVKNRTYLLYSSVITLFCTVMTVLALVHMMNCDKYKVAMTLFKILMLKT